MRKEFIGVITETNLISVADGCNSKITIAVPIDLSHVSNVEKVYLFVYKTYSYCSHLFKIQAFNPSKHHHY